MSYAKKRLDVRPGDSIPCKHINLDSYIVWS